MKVLFVADFFVSDVNGGGEQNNEEVIRLLREHVEVDTLHSHLLTQKEIDNSDFLIFGNFLGVDKRLLEYCAEKKNYIIYEHDHKYLKSRNPSLYHDYRAPLSQLTNTKFYERAKAVLCQSSFHQNIVEKNLGYNNTINLSGNAWLDETLDFILALNKRFPFSERDDIWAIMKSDIYHKNTAGAIEWCKAKEFQFRLIPAMAHHHFLLKMSKNKNFIFLPQTPETLSRVVVEARMLNMNVEAADNIGAKHESWFDLSGKSLIDFMRERKYTIVRTILRIVNENSVSR